MQGIWLTYVRGAWLIYVRDAWLIYVRLIYVRDAWLIYVWCRIIGQLRGNKKYRVAKKLGSGSFGEIYLGQHVTSGDEVWERKACLSCIYIHLYIHIYR